MKSSSLRAATLLLLALLSAASRSGAQTTAFTYQGRLSDGGVSANGNYDLTFQLFDAVTNGTPKTTLLTNSSVVVSSGLFTVSLDFGSTPFDGTDRYLQIGTRATGSASQFSQLVPRQRIASAPYAVTAANGVHSYGPSGTFIGPAAGNTTVSGFANLGIGAGALQNVTSGGENLAIGLGALGPTTTAEGNTAVGNQALQHNTGRQNTAFGYGALPQNTSGDDNVAIGYEAMGQNTTGSGNVAIGNFAGTGGTNGVDNVTVGNSSLVGMSSGNFNVAIGYLNAPQLTGGSDNVFIGDETGYNLHSTSDGSILISNGGVDGDTHVTRIGASQTKAYMAGIYGVTVPSAQPVYVGSDGKLGSMNSSERFKQNVEDMGSASAAVLAMRPVKFQYKPDIDPNGLPQYGLIAEEVEKVAPELVLRDGKGQIMSVRYEAINAMLLNEFLKEHAELADKESKIEALEKRLDNLEKAIAPMTTK